jgi:hypothetical protein
MKWWLALNQYKLKLLLFDNLWFERHHPLPNLIEIRMVVKIMDKINMKNRIHTGNIMVNKGLLYNLYFLLN